MERIPKAKEILKKEWTDIDVLGWRYNTLSSIELITASIKGVARQTKDKAEILKLAGLNGILNPIKSFYVKDHLSLEELFLFSRDLNILVVSSESLQDLLDRSIDQYKEKTDFSLILKKKGADLIGKSLDLMKSLDLKSYEFLTTGIWRSNFPIKYYRAEQSLCNSANLYEENKKYTIILLLYSISSYLITIAELLSKLDCCRLQDFDLFLIKTMEKDAEGSELAMKVIKTFKDIIRTGREDKKVLDQILEKNFSLINIFPEFKFYSGILKECWKKNFAVFLAIRIIDFLMLTYADKEIYINVENLPKPLFPASKNVEDALYLIRFILLKFIKERNLPRLKTFCKNFNILTS